MKMLSEFMGVVDNITASVERLVTKLENKMAARIDSLAGVVAETKEAAGKAATAEEVDAIRSALASQAEDFRNEMTAKLSPAPAVQIKSVTGAGGILSVELSNGETTEIELPAAEPGRDGENGRDGIDGKDGSAGRDGVDGKDGENGRDGGNGENGADGVGIVEVKNLPGAMALILSNGKEYVVDLPKPDQPAAPAAPVDITDAMIDREGSLTIVFSNGQTKNVGKIVGRDGVDGINGLDGARGLDGINGIDGRDGIDGAQGMAGAPGRDGFGFDDMSAELLEDGRTVVFKFQRGDDVKAFPMKFPVSIFRGAYDSERVYEPGDGVFWMGHSYSATREVVGVAPEGGDGAWTKLASAGQSVRGERGIAGKDGRNGLDGKDLRAFT